MAGLHVTFRCLRPISAALQRQVAAAGIAAHWVRSPAGASDLILGFGRIPEPQIVPGIRTLGHTLASPAGRGRGA